MLIALTARRMLPHRWFLALLIGVCPLLSAQNVDPWQLRTAFIYNFSQFIEWPAEAFTSPTAPFNICIVGNHRFGQNLQSLEKRNVRGHPVAVLSLQQVHEARSCHILYMANSRAIDSKQWAAELGRLPILTIIETDEVRNLPAGIGFIEQGGKLRWIINIGMLRQINLKVSAKLIEIAVAVIGE